MAANKRVGSSNSQREGYMDESCKSFEPVSDNRGPAIGKSMKAYSGFYLIERGIERAHNSVLRPIFVVGQSSSHLEARGHNRQELIV